MSRRYRSSSYPSRLRLTRRDLDSESKMDTPKILGGLLLVVGAGWAFKHFVLDAKPALQQPQPTPSGPAPPNLIPGGLPGVPPASPGLPNLPSIPGLPQPTPSGPTLPTLPGATPLAMSVGQGDVILVDSKELATILGPTAMMGPTAVEMRVVSASPGSPTVQAQFTDPKLAAIPPVPVPRQAIVGIVASPSSPAPGSPGAPPMGAPLYLDNPMRLRTGQRYRARVQLGAFESAFASRSAVEGQFTALGFSNVAAYEPDATPTDWPSATKQGDLARTWFVEGTWTQPERQVAKPPQVIMAWEG